MLALLDKMKNDIIMILVCVLTTSHLKVISNFKLPAKSNFICNLKAKS